MNGYPTSPERPTSGHGTHADRADGLQSQLRIVKNTGILLALRVGMPLLSMAIVLAISRLLGASI